jgi:RHS repeat-associated protein
VARGATEYRYDPVGHLLAMVHPVGQKVLVGGSEPLGDPAAELFRYDPTGNVYEDGPGAPQRVYGRGNRLLRSGDTDYEWDADSNLIARHTRNAASGTDERWEYQWNDFGFMSAATGPDLHIEFEYDSFARRLEKRVYRRKLAGIAELPTQDRGELLRRTRFVWDRDVLAHEIREELVLDPAGGEEPSVAERTYWFADEGFEPWAHREKRTDDVGTESTGWFHYVNDPVGTPERLVAEDGAVAAEYRRAAWGALEVAPGATATTPLRFQGQYADEETGLAYNRHRYYDPQVGRFSSADLIGIFSDHNVFRWTGNPIYRIDELGLATHKGQGYNHWFEAKIPKSMYLSSDDAHFRESNRQLHARMSTDSRYRACMEARYPGITNHVAPGPKGGYNDNAPPGTTWHHHPTRPGCLQLVDRKDHNARHGVYHPTGVGGRNTWGGGSEYR